MEPHSELGEPHFDGITFKTGDETFDRLFAKVGDGSFHKRNGVEAEVLDSKLYKRDRENQPPEGVEVSRVRYSREGTSLEGVRISRSGHTRLLLDADFNLDNLESLWDSALHISGL